MTRTRWALVVALLLGALSFTGAPPSAASDNGLALRPPMGWSSWSFVRRLPTEAKIKAQADALAASGLKSHGFVYVNLDDFWQKCDASGFTVDAYGRWAVDPAKFPSGIKALADYVHAKGLKFGFYVTPGIAENAVTRNTPVEGTSYHARDIADTSRTEKNYNCKHMYYLDHSKPGAQEFVDSWARQFASWGVDYLKIDGVGSADTEDVRAWDRALRATGRPIVFGLSNNLPVADAATWRQLANSWRTQGDIECYCGSGDNGSGYPLTDWAHVTARFDKAAAWQPYAGPGGWSDLDSLEVGNGDQVGLTADQRRSMFTLWAMAASPLLLGTDLTALDATDKAMLTNDRLIGVDQDGVAASRIVNDGVRQVWSKREANGAYVVALFNTGTSGSASVGVDWSRVGFSGDGDVTDLWSGRHTGTVSGSYSATLRPGETRLIRVVPTAARAAAPAHDGGFPSTIGTLSDGWTVPWGIHWMPDGRTALVTERDDFRVWKVTKDGTKTRVGTVPDVVTTNGEGGLLGVAVDPRWETNHYVYFMHTASEGNRVVRMTYDGGSLSGYTVLLQGIKKNRYHNGGRLAFGPDGYLYVSTGDGQTSDLAQDTGSLNGKILRMTTDGRPAPGNPFGNYVYSYGHRNPQGLAFDRNGRLWEAEFGNSSKDELNLIKPGANYGWPVCEGTCQVSGMTNPKTTWNVAEASPSGIAIVRNVVYMASLRGERLWRIPITGDTENVGTATAYYVGTYGRLRTVTKVPGEDELWLSTTNSDNNGGEPDGSDQIFRVSIS